jgi:peptidoglycan/LPS O-acetylase OafA/YrhL
MASGGLQFFFVLAFHGYQKQVPGGFIGVDIFFVISGYLISSILLDDLSNHRFSIHRFYSRRIKRIFPALIAVLAVSIMAGWLLLLPDEFKILGKHVFAGATFASNLVLTREDGDYFDFHANSKPLLHLWSLGIEEQFYIFFRYSCGSCTGKE